VLRAGLLDGVVPPQVAALGPGHLLAGAADHDDVADGRALGDRLVHGRLERRRRAAPVATVGGDDERGVLVLDAALERVDEKPPKTTEWVAPMRAQASMATTASGIMGM
jgi:hypothetical protein